MGEKGGQTRAAAGYKTYTTVFFIVGLERSRGKVYIRGFLLGLFLGTAIGAVVSLLYAPVRGTEAREAVKSKTRAAASKVGELTSAAGAKMKKAGEGIKQAI